MVTLWMSVRVRSNASGAGEPERDLALGRLGTIRAVHQVLVRGGGEVAPDAAGLRVGHLGLADEDPAELPRGVVGALNDHRHHGRAGEEGDELAEEGPLAVLVV